MKSTARDAALRFAGAGTIALILSLLINRPRQSTQNQIRLRDARVI